MNIQSIIIVGDSLAAWSAAALLAKQVPKIKISVLESRVADEAAAESAMPSLREFHKLLKINEREIALSTEATFKLATRFSDWLRPGQDYWLGLGEVGHNLDGIEFQHYATLLHQCGDSTAYDAYSLTAKAARHHVFNPLSGEQQALGFQLPYALQMDINRYKSILKDVACCLGVSCRRDEVAQVIVDSADGNIDALYLRGGEQISADFFIDCTGSSAQLISQLADDRYIQVEQHKLLGDRRLDWVTPTQPAGCAVLKAQSVGWKKSITLRNCTHQHYFYSSDFLNDEQALTKISLLYPDAILTANRLRTGHRTQPWLKNCLALGAAAGDIGNLVLSPLHLVHSALLRWLDLFPVENCPAFAREYNRLTKLEHERLLDFHWLPFALSQRKDSAYWRACAAAAVSEPLAHRLALFRQSGKISRYEQETFTASSWAALFLANQCWPQKYDARLQGVNIEQVQRYTSQLKTHIQQMITAMPSQDDYLSVYHSCQ